MAKFTDAVTCTSDLTVAGTARFPGGVATEFARTQLAQEVNARYQVPLTDLRVHDAIQTVLPGTAASDDLGIIGTAFGTSSVVVRTSDAKATTVTQRARFQFVLPPEYEAGQTVVCRVFAGMDTTVSDGTATVDIECYEADGEGGISADLCATAAQSINSLTNANDDFTITATALEPGSVLDVRVTIAITDTATATAVLGEIGFIEFLLDIRG